jgi:3-isopropylmalate/(R)-2-methylmalate dehydratase small subunit
MEPFNKMTAKVAPMNRVNVDTDAIVPARYLKRIERTGWGEFLFYDWAHDSNGKLKGDFILNKPEYKDAKIMVVGENFGSGSSREHAVWAIAQAGYRALVTSSLADIFHNNCFENGVVPVLVDEETLKIIMEKTETIAGYELTVDLEAGEIYDSEGLQAHIGIDQEPEEKDLSSSDQEDSGIYSEFVVHRDKEAHEFRSYTLQNGFDEIGRTLQKEDKIDAFEAKIRGDAGSKADIDKD